MVQDGRWYQRVGMSTPNELGRTEDAIEMYRKAVELDSDDPITRAAFREALAMQGSTLMRHTRELQPSSCSAPISRIHGSRLLLAKH